MAANDNAPRKRARTRPYRLPARPFLGSLPLARIVSQRAHSVLDYASVALAACGLLVARTRAGRTACLVLAGSGLASTALSHHELSPVKLIPIEVHEALDYAWGLGAIAWPFVTKHARRERALTALHVMVGAVTI